MISTRGAASTFGGVFSEQPPLRAMLCSPFPSVPRRWDGPASVSHLCAATIARRSLSHTTYKTTQVLEKSRIGGADDFVRVKREMEVMRTLDHPNVAILEDVLEDEKHYYFVLEFVEGGELFDYIVTHQYIREKDARRPFRQICVSGLVGRGPKGWVLTVSNAGRSGILPPQGRGTPRPQARELAARLEEADQVRLSGSVLFVQRPLTIVSLSLSQDHRLWAVQHHRARTASQDGVRGAYPALLFLRLCFCY